MILQGLWRLAFPISTSHLLALENVLPLKMSSHATASDTRKADNLYMSTADPPWIYLIIEDHLRDITPM